MSKNKRIFAEYAFARERNPFKTDGPPVVKACHDILATLSVTGCPHRDCDLNVEIVCEIGQYIPTHVIVSGEMWQ